MRSGPVLARHLLLMKDLGEILEALGEKGLGPLVLKGSTFASHLYPSPDMRPMEDIDLLVPPGRLGEVRAVLEEMGYRPRSSSSNELLRGSTVVDLESEIWYLSPLEQEGLWERSLLLEKDGLRLPTLSWEDHFVFVLAHSAAHHGWWDETHSEDLRRLLSLKLDWNAVAAFLPRLRLPAAASFQVLGLPVPPELRESLAIPFHERPLLQLYGWLLKRGPLPGIGHFLRLASSPAPLASLLQSFFPGRDFLGRRYGTRWPVVYALLRPAFLIGSCLRALLLTPLSIALTSGRR